MRTAIWKSMLDADMNFRYWKRLTQKYIKRDRNFKAFVAIASSATVGAWVAGVYVGAWGTDILSYGWKILSGFSAVLAILLPFMKYPDIIKTAASLSGNWWGIKNEYEDIWRRIESGGQNGFEEQYRSVRTSEIQLIKQEIGIPEDQGLLRKAQREVLHANRLD